MKKKLAFIGGGNMARSIIRGLVAQETLPASDIHVSGPHPEKLGELEALGIRVHRSNLEAAVAADIIVLAVKPNIIPTVLVELYDVIGPEKLVISIAAGITMQKLESALPPATRIVRAMPNTPAEVGEGVTAVTHNGASTIEDMADTNDIFGACGIVEWVDEQLIDTVIGIAGSAPAYFFLMLEAMGDAAVKGGMKRNMAYRIAAQAMLGSAKLALTSERHPGALKDDVCSPGGSTIEAVQALEDTGFRSSVLAAVDAAITKSRRMNNE